MQPPINAIIYDAEIIKAIAKHGEERQPNIEYCNGWRDFKNMGISVIGAYDYLSDQYRVFCRDNFDELARRLHDADIVIDFNGTQFDKPLMEATGLHKHLGSGIEGFEFTSHYDILREIWKAEGHDPDRFNYATHANYGLDACCATNFGTTKTGHGALAPIDWQRGNIGKVIDYCLNDVRLTKQLFDQILNHGYIRNPKDRSKIIQMRLPLHSPRLSYQLDTTLDFFNAEHTAAA